MRIIIFCIRRLVLVPIFILVNIAVLILQGFLLFWLFIFKIFHEDFEFYYIVKSWFFGTLWQILNLSILLFPPFCTSVFLYLLKIIIGKDRFSHTYILGKSGSGKSSSLEHFLYLDVLSGHGIALIEPHGDLTERFLYHNVFSKSHPSRARKRLVVLDFESMSPTAFNIFNVNLPDDTKNRQMRIDALVSGYSMAFKKALSPEMSKNMIELLKHCISAVFWLEKPTFFDLMKILSSEEYLEKRYLALFSKLPCRVLQNFFRTDFVSPELLRTKMALKRRLTGLIRNTQLQKSLCSEKNSVDFRKIMKEGKILVVKASKGLGDDISKLIGNLVLQFIYDESFHRLKSGKKAIPFFCYIDECHNYISDSVIKGISEGRKFGLHFVLANQYLGQDMTDREQKAVLNANVKICGKVNHQDAVKMANEMGLKDKNRFLRLKSGEFFYQSGHRFARFLKFTKCFAVPSHLIGKKRFRRYMKSSEKQEMMEEIYARGKKSNQVDLKNSDSNKNLEPQGKSKTRGIQKHIENSLKNSKINKFLVFSKNNSLINYSMAYFLSCFWQNDVISII